MELERVRRNDVGTLRSLDLEHRAGASGTTRHAMIPQAILPELGRPRHGTAPRPPSSTARTEERSNIALRGQGLPPPAPSRGAAVPPPPPGARPFPRGTLFVQVPRGPSPKRSWTAVWGSVHEAFVANPFPGGTSVRPGGARVSTRGRQRRLDRGPAAPTRPGSGRADSTWVRPRAAAGSGRLSRRRRTARGMPG